MMFILAPVGKCPAVEGRFTAGKEHFTAERCKNHPLPHGENTCPPPAADAHATCLRRPQNGRLPSIAKLGMSLRSPELHGPFLLRSRYEASSSLFRADRPALHRLRAGDGSESGGF